MLTQSDEAIDMSARGHLLLAEDNPAHIQLVEAIFQVAGWTCKVVNDGSQVLAAVKSEPFDLVLMDFHMPHLNGVEATVMIREWEKSQGRPALPIIGITASAMTHEIDLCLRSGMDRVIIKPFDVQALLSVLEESGRRFT